jgi:hypothetical protein
MALRVERRRCDPRADEDTLIRLSLSAHTALGVSWQRPESGAFKRRAQT